jgi:hypothetical protein
VWLPLAPEKAAAEAPRVVDSKGTTSPLAVVKKANR